ncbi:MAG: GntR family transcriptional regulator, partial [Spirochaetales bacterium]|nr:GntR family transcriptional regulator [Spirochaetales bacterium]
QELTNTKEEINRELYSIMQELVRYGERFTASNPFYTYESIVGESSPTVNKTLGELSFWQRTQATVIAVRRGGSMLLSPGPDFAFESLDVLM